MSDLQQLFDTDPLLLTNPQIDQIVARQREHQAQQELGLKPASKTPPKPKSTKTMDLLKDLGLA